MPDQDGEPTVRMIAPTDLWQTLIDGITKFGNGEAVFELSPQTLQIRKADSSTVAITRQLAHADAFESYEVESAFEMGVPGNTFTELLKNSKADTAEFAWDWDTFKWSFRSDDIDYEMAGVNPDAVKGSPSDVPAVKDSLAYVADATVPSDKLKRAVKIADLNSGSASFLVGGEDDGFVIEGSGDTDAGRVHIHEDPAFEWNDDPPETQAESRQSVEYLKTVTKLLDEDTVRIVTGDELPYHLWTERNGVATKIIQAPYIDAST